MGKALFGLIPLAMLAGCGGAAENKAKAKADSLQPGQYEVTAEITTFRASDKGTPKITGKQGDSTTRSVCVTDGASLPPDLFADEGMNCRSAGTMFARGGILNVTLQCERAGETGLAGYTVEGTFAADSFEGRRNMRTSFAGDGDVEISAQLRGRRTGDCSAAPAAPAGKSK